MSLFDWQQSLLQCPFDGSDVIVADRAAQCVRCERTFPVQDGIVRFVVPDLEHLQDPDEWRWKQSEMEARNEQASFYDRLIGLMILTPLEGPMTVKALFPDTQCVPLLAEIGCGTGRMLVRLASRAQKVIGVDISFESLRKCRERLQAAGKRDYLLVHADASFLPLKSASVDAVASCQMIEHLPSDRMRRKAVQEMTRLLKVGGRFALSGYHWSWLVRWFGPKEGVHKGGIYYYRFTRDEFLSLIPSEIKTEKLTSIAGYAWLVSGVKVRGQSG
ncbi:MAG: class I SAM-dependent methyltransferase [Armatimonadetes bacterium]|nr:class I SAM-dependent methyltransferase [Armatimonadota bacterium]